MDGRRELGEFLKARRSQVRPEDIGLATYGDQRRVPGLRREELALLAGISPSYYSRLERAESTNASPEVLDAIAGALGLDGPARQHLHALAGAPRRRSPRRAAPERVTPAVAHLVSALGDVPVVVLGRRSDVLAWNRTGHALYAGHLDPDAPRRAAGRPNMARLVFLDAHTRDLYADWPAKAAAVVGSLRLAGGRHPDDAELAALVGELTVKSDDFASLWADHRLKTGLVAVYAMHHPLVGALEVTQQTLQAEQGQQVVVATAEPGSPSQTALALLAHAVASVGPVGPVGPVRPIPVAPASHPEQTVR